MRVFSSDLAALLRWRRFSLVLFRLTWLLTFATEPCRLADPGAARRAGRHAPNWWPDERHRARACDRGPDQDPQPVHRGPHRPRQVDLVGPDLGADGGRQPPGDAGPVPRLDGHRA